MSNKQTKFQLIANLPNKQQTQNQLQQQHSDDEQSELERLEIIAKIIKKTRRCAGYPELQDDILVEWVNDWFDELDCVPTEWLEAATSRAIKSCMVGHVSVALIIQAYKDLLLGQTGRSVVTGSDCKNCFGSGWQRVTSRHELTGKDISAVKPCQCANGRKLDSAYGRTITKG